MPCTKEMSGYLRTVYATVRERFQETSKESAVRWLYEPAALVGSITVSPYW
ncbi:MAG TPA: hypothetical protein VK395_13865 [Gemmataceae bacterium]|nr:hypothetical protein [Gemmataceae bacterium]